MAKRSGTNLGSSTLRGSEHEYLRFVLSPEGATGDFDQDDDQSNTVVNDSNFPQGDRYIWRLQSAPDAAGTKLTATDDAGQPIPDYLRVVKPTFIPTYTVAMIFGLAIGYELRADRCSAAGEVIENIIKVKYTDGAAGEVEKELIQLDLGQA
jgi:hypothetical protein